MRRGTLAVIIGNRGVFPGSLAEKGRREMLAVLKEEGVEAILPPASETKYGAIENLSEAKKCADLFRKNRDQIDGILVSLPNFGDERAIADTIKMAGLDVPILVQAYPDELKKMGIDDRRDSFCGKISVCNNLKQYGFPFSLTDLHTVSPASKDFKQDLAWFLGVCRVVKGLRKARIGAIGARTTPFKTVRYSEKLLEEAGISTETIDLSEIITAVQRLKDSDRKVQEKLKAIAGYCATSKIPQPALSRMAKLGVVVEEWIKENELDACAFQCWSALQDALGIFPCGLMSMMSDAFLPCACEVDVMGAVAMLALQLASGLPSGLFDWNNNYGDDPERLVLFHCSNLPGTMLKRIEMDYNGIVARKMGKENSYGTCVGRVKPGPMTFLRVSTEDTTGSIIACLGEGAFTNDPLDTFGGVGVARIANLQELLHFLCESGLEHHVAISPSSVSDIIWEALNKYLGWDVYYHRSE